MSTHTSDALEYPRDLNGGSLTLIAPCRNSAARFVALLKYRAFG
jgi:hypothetical protein